MIEVEINSWKWPISDPWVSEDRAFLARHKSYSKTHYPCFSHATLRPYDRREKEVTESQRYFCSGMLVQYGFRTKHTWRDSIRNKGRGSWSSNGPWVWKPMPQDLSTAPRGHVELDDMWPGEPGSCWWGIGSVAPTTQRDDGGISFSVADFESTSALACFLRILFKSSFIL